MAGEPIGKQWWFPCTCGCVFQYVILREGLLWDTASLEFEEVIEKCESHAVLSDEEAEAAVNDENSWLAKAYGEVLEDTVVAEAPAAPYPGLGTMTAWQIIPEPMSGVRKLHVNVRDASPTLQGKLTSISANVTATFSDIAPFDMEDIPQSDVAIPAWGTASKQKVLQGCHREYGYNFGQDEFFSEYFNVVGSGALVTRYQTRFNVDFGDDATYKASKHVVNFDGSAARFTVKVDANNRPAQIVHRIRKNNADTDLGVVVPAERIGVFVNIETVLDFESGESLVGYRFSDPDVPADKTRCNLRAVHFEMESLVGEHTIFRASGADGASLDDGSVPPPAFSSYPIAGTLDHYRSTITLEESSTADDSEMPLTALIRAAGTLSKMQAGWEPTERAALLGLRVNSEPDADWDNPPFPNVPISQAESPFLAFKFHADNPDTAEIANSDIVAFMGIDQPVGTGGNTIHGVGINWEADPGVDVIDHFVCESFVDSYDNSDGDRIDKFEFVKPVEVPEDDDDYDREWYASPLGTVHPYSRDQLWRLPLRFKDIEVSLSFDIRMQYLRGYLDTHSLDPDQGLSLRILIGGGIGDLRVRLNDPAYKVFEDAEWYENETDHDDVLAGVGFCLKFTAELGYGTSKAHVSMVGFSYKNKPPSRDCLVRVLPDVEAVEPLSNLIRLARSVKIVRTDGQIFTYTEHDRDITYDVGDGDGPLVYKSCGGFEGSASELGSILGEVGNMEILGFAKALGITIDDLFGGAFDGAEAKVWLLPWGEGNTEPARRHGGGTFGPVKQKDRTYKLEALSWSEYLKRRSLLGSYTPTCRHKLGPIPEGDITGCGVDLECMRVTGVVAEVEGEDDPIANGATVRTTFYDPTRTEENGWFAEGEVTMIDGANAGQSRTVKYSVLSTGEISVWEPFIYPIEAGDAYSMTPGCDKKKRTCIDKFNNLVNPVAGGFGGMSEIPGLDATSQTPTGRSGE